MALEVAGDPEITNSLDALGRELIFRREDSLRSRVRRLAWEAVPELDQDDRVAFSRRVVRLYDLRSQLVHEGAVPLAVLGKANDEARQLVGEILRVQLLKGRTSA